MKIFRFLTTVVLVGVTFLPPVIPAVDGNPDGNPEGPPPPIITHPGTPSAK
jgi:hypothetical protein